MKYGLEVHKTNLLNEKVVKVVVLVNGVARAAESVNENKLNTSVKIWQGIKHTDMHSKK